MMPEPSALTLPPASKWWPVKRKVWAATAGAMLGAAAGIYVLSDALVGLTVEGMCAFFVCPSPRAEAYLLIVYTSIVAGAGSFIAGYVLKERA